MTAYWSTCYFNRIIELRWERMPRLKVITTLLIENDKETVENRIWPWKKNGTKMVKVYRHVKCRNYNYRVTPYNWVCPNISHNTCIRCLGSLYPGMIITCDESFVSFQQFSGTGNNDSIGNLIKHDSSKCHL